MNVDVRRDAIRKDEPLGIFSLALLNAVSVAVWAPWARVVKLMPASRCSPRSEYGIGIGADLAISEIDEHSSHFNLDRNDADHPCVID